MEFNYLENDLLDWMAKSQGGRFDLDEYEIELLAVVRDHYLPEFEAAIWRLAAENAR